MRGAEDFERGAVSGEKSARSCCVCTSALLREKRNGLRKRKVRRKEGIGWLGGAVAVRGELSASGSGVIGWARTT